MKRQDLIGAIAGIAVLLITALVIKLPLALAVVLGVVTYVGVRFLVPEPSEVVPGMTGADVNRAIREGQAKVDQIKKRGNQVDNAEVRARILRICTITESILADFRADPKDIMYAPDFVQDYLTPLVNVIDRYVRLSSTAMAGTAGKTLGDIEGDLLPTVEKNFSGLYQRLIQDDVVDLDSASAGLKSILELSEYQP